MIELTEKEIGKLNQGRILRTEAQVLLPLLQKRRDAATAKLLAAFRVGDEKGLLTGAAELCALTDLETDMKRNIKETEQLERRVYAEPE